MADETEIKTCCTKSNASRVEVLWLGQYERSPVGKAAQTGPSGPIGWVTNLDNQAFVRFWKIWQDSLHLGLSYLIQLAIVSDREGRKWGQVSI